MEETATTFTNQSADDSILSITKPGASFLLETSKWTFFLSIMGFILVGIMILVSIFLGSILSMLPGSEGADLPPGFGIMMGVIYFLLALVYFFPSLYLFNFSRKLKSALATRDNNELVLALENQKSLYKFWGIFAIVMIAIYAVIIVFSALVAAFVA